MSAAPEVVTIVKRLSTYLKKFPQASDTPEGIACWWVEPGVQARLAAVEAALNWMVNCGVLAATSAADGRVHYRCRHDIDDLEVRLDALSRDPYLMLPASQASPPQARWS